MVSEAIRIEDTHLDSVYKMRLKKAKIDTLNMKSNKTQALLEFFDISSIFARYNEDIKPPKIIM